ncbi:hypothetical protein, partial [Ignatzschineria cameli]|uniref:hypothetical protein n=1 Tax=Ignatzschineria cameli TaxID=2182793 RepID=UPI00195D9F50
PIGAFIADDKVSLITGNSSASVVSTNKKICGAVGVYYFILLTGACPPFGIDDAGSIFYLTNICR